MTPIAIAYITVRQDVCRRLRLDTIDGKMATAASLDKPARFVDILPEPRPDTVCMELVL